MKLICLIATIILRGQNKVVYYHTYLQLLAFVEQTQIARIRYEGYFLNWITSVLFTKLLNNIYLNVSCPMKGVFILLLHIYSNKEIAFHSNTENALKRFHVFSSEKPF